MGLHSKVLKAVKGSLKKKKLKPMMNKFANRKMRLLDHSPLEPIGNKGILRKGNYKDLGYTKAKRRRSGRGGEKQYFLN